MNGMRAPQEPTIVKEVPEQGSYTIPFAPELTEYIKQEGKVKTYRFGDKYDYLEVGNTVRLTEYGTNEHIGDAEITEKMHTTFGELPLDIEGHEVYESKEHQRRVFSGYYKYIGRVIEDSDPFLVISFKLIKK